MKATRELFWNTNGKELMYFLAVITFILFVVGCQRKIRNWRNGRPENTLTEVKIRLKDLIFNLFTHKNSVFKGEFYRRMHLAIFYGFFVLLIGTFIIAIQEDLHIPLFYGKLYLISSLFLDSFGLLFLLGILMAVYKRCINKPERIENTTDDAIILTLVFLIISTGFILEGLRIYLTEDTWALWTPVGLMISAIIRKVALSTPLVRSVHSFLWYFHMILAFIFIAYIPYSKLFHMLASPLYLYIRPTSPQWSLQPNNGVTRYTDFSRKQLIELDACVSCGRCLKNCPAYLNGAPLVPKRLLQNLKKGARFNKRDKNILNQVIPKETLWACTTCGLCQEKCPMTLEHVQRIVDLRRSLPALEGGYPPEIYPLFNHLAREGNPWGLSLDSSFIPVEIPIIKEKQQTDVLYWVGCFGAYDSRTANITRAMADILRASGTDFALLGTEEICCGDSARRLGNEKLFQQLARENIEILNSYKFNTIVTHCPHCLNTLKNEYPQFGGHFRVIHHTQFIFELIKSGKLPLKSNKIKATYHDPCYLGRYNNIFEAPRDILKQIPGLELQEIKHNREKSFCCGAGGGRIWMPDELTKKMNLKRVKEATKDEPEVIVSACPLCLTSFAQTMKSFKPQIKTKDIAEIVRDSMQST